MYVARYVFGSGKYMGLLPRNKLGFWVRLLSKLCYKNVNDPMFVDEYL